jgi:N-methylhydantoinase A/oxoprolinase/acetone carboxylase beta subunit
VGLPTPAIMQSSGGLAGVDIAADHAALTVLSGPAGGAAAAALLAERCGEPDLLCFDMGGTSCDVCVVEGGRVRETTAREVGGRPLALPMVDIHTVGAGGGSIGWRDPGGALRVGPRSAGAEPGPACYGRGGTEPTVTDANLVLGHLSADVPLAGDVELDAEAAHAAVERLAGELGLDVRECAEGIVRVANAEMVRALRVMTVERGIDPRRFALLAFGGAGPLHAAAIAEELGMTRILVPRASGVLSALGLAAADRRADAQRTVLGDGDASVDALRDEVTGALGGEPEVEIAWDLRYRGQSHELTVRGAARDELRERFEALHEERYGHRDPDGEVELVTIRVTGRLPAAPVDFAAPAGEQVTGPAVVALPEATLVVPEGWSGTTDDTGTIVLERA